jgi:hypothetical protein
MNNNDPLLIAGRVMSVLLMGMTLLVTILLVTLVPVTLFMPEWLFEEAEVSRSAIGAVMAILLLTAIVTAGAFYFFRLLGQMIKSAGEESPFSIENANRLSRMGWIALIFQIASFPISALAAYLGHLLPEGNFAVDFEFSLTGLLLAIVLFILARVFKLGAAMHDDLEGTV